MVTAWLATFSGCGSLLTSNEPPQRVYWLEPTAMDAAPGTPLRVRVSLVPGLNSDHIWILQPDMRLNYFAGALWAERLDVVLRSVIERSLDVDDGSGGNIELDILIERFFAVEDSSGTPASVALQARIRRSDWQGHACVFTTTTRPATARLRDIVAAHQAALDELVQTLKMIAASASSDRPRNC